MPTEVQLMPNEVHLMPTEIKLMPAYDLSWTSVGPNLSIVVEKLNPLKLRQGSKHDNVENLRVRTG